MIVLDDLKNLSAIPGPCLTIIQPLRDPFSQVTRADTRLTAAAQRADELLVENRVGPEARAEFLRPIHKFARNTEWAERTGSVVIFRAPGFTKAIFWPDILDARVILGQEFLVLPLLPRLLGEDHFWVLALSINRVQLFEGSAHDLAEVPLPDTLPRSLRDAEGFATPDHDLAAQSSGGSNKQGGSVHFGTSPMHDRQAAYLRDFFKAIERAIKPRLEASGAPLILAAVPKELAIYRDVNTYAWLLPQAVHGSPDGTPAPKLHEKALEIFRTVGVSLDGKAREEMENAAGRGLLLTEAFGIRDAAVTGQVERLYLNPAQGPDEALLNAAALAVLANSGTVVCGESPDGMKAAAILRYRAARRSA